MIATTGTEPSSRRLHRLNLSARSVIILSYAVLAMFVVLIVRYQIELLTFAEVGDESETIVAAKMIVSGQSLYSEIFNHHGPLTFLPGVVTNGIADAGVSGNRVPIVLLQWAALASIYFSPLLKSPLIRNAYTAGAGVVMVLYIPASYGFTYTYQTLAGLMVLIALAQFVLPAIIRDEGATRTGTIVGSVLLVGLVFLAVSYVPFAVLLFVVALRRGRLRIALISAGASLVANLLFLTAIGSVRGYLVDHFYVNLVILPIYNGQNTITLIEGGIAAISSSPAMFLILVVLAFAIARLGRLEADRFPWRAVLMAAAFASMLVRGEILQGLPYQYGAIAIPLVLLYGTSRLWRPTVIAAVAAVALICLIRVSLVLPADQAALSAQHRAPTTEFGVIAQGLTSPDDRIIAFTFNNYEYLSADRLPASGNFFYFPWQQDYTDDPVLGLAIDTCDQIKATEPKVMYLDKWTVWGAYPWADYAGCVDEYVTDHYTQVPGKPYYVRNDIPIQKALDLLPVAPTP